MKENKKIYGFINIENNCYLNSSLQLLTRIKELKNRILNFTNICKDTVTKGKLLIEFKNILIKINNDIDNQPIINPEKLKIIFGEIDQKYNEYNQEDANEFISHFINALLGETANKNILIPKLEIYNEMEDMERKAYDIFYNKFYIKKGYSFILDLFYGILKIEKYCKNNNCKKVNSIKFNAYNTLQLPIYYLAKQDRYKPLNIYEILNKYTSEYKNEYDICKYCDKKEIYTKISLYTLPKYLIIFFARIVGEEYNSADIEYPKVMNFKNLINNKNNNYSKFIIDCVIEHFGNAHFGHYTALCPIDENNDCWIRFNDNHFHRHINGYKSKNVVILLYKSINR